MLFSLDNYESRSQRSISVSLHDINFENPTKEEGFTLQTLMVPLLRLMTNVAQQIEVFFFFCLGVKI